MAVCGNCGRGDDQQNERFVCPVCGAQNNADGSVEYDDSRVAVDDMRERIDAYDEYEQR
jgi:transcription initiation factor IIE alpha subunit